ncbi:MAG: tetratricopeptide repeat protein [Bacteroidales bacterium]
MMKFRAHCLLFFCFLVTTLTAQINTDRVMSIGKNALYFEDYLLSIQYFNQVIKVKPYLAEPYFFRAVAKLELGDFKGAEEDCALSIERNPFITNSYECRGIARLNLGDNKGAVEDFDRGLEYSPENKSMLLNKALAHLEMKNTEAAGADLEKLIKLHPNFYNAYVTRASYSMEVKDTLQAISDLSKAIDIDKNNFYAWANRGLIKYEKKDFKGAVADLDEAVKLEPDKTALYVNRGIVRYNLNDLRGAMADYDRVLTLEPNNVMGLYNRGLLRAQVGDNNRAIKDFDNLLKQEPDNYFAYYNRGLLREETGDLKGAVADISKVIDEYADFLPGYYLRSEIKRKMNDVKGAELDYWTAMELQRKHRENKQNQNLASNNSSTKDSDKDDDANDKQARKKSDKNINKFKNLMMADDAGLKSKYENQYRGRVQDRNVSVKLTDNFVLTYYERGDKVSNTIHYDKFLETFNKQSGFRRKLLLVNAEPPLNEMQMSEHFRSIDDFSHLIENDKMNPVPYFGRSIDFMLVQDFNSALEDLNRVIILKTDFALAYFQRAVVRSKQLEYEQSQTDEYEYQGNKKGIAGFKNPAESKVNKSPKLDFEIVMRDYDRAIELNPRFAYAYFNRANVRSAQKDFRNAVLDLDQAIRIDPEFAEAYFNRGLLYIYLDQNEKGFVDLSKAGELGMSEAYNIIKRLSDKN